MQQRLPARCLGAALKRNGNFVLQNQIEIDFLILNLDDLIFLHDPLHLSHLLLDNFLLELILQLNDVVPVLALSHRLLALCLPRFTEISHPDVADVYHVIGFVHVCAICIQQFLGVLYQVDFAGEVKQVTVNSGWDALICPGKGLRFLFSFFYLFFRQIMALFRWRNIFWPFI